MFVSRVPTDVHVTLNRFAAAPAWIHIICPNVMTFATHDRYLRFWLME